ncbi:ribosome maturation factor RimP [Terrimonas alba]|uniref:ribosome maturation factor RimP n=1 Tax=Terrimonas alba TaxID=3349636 RepID=UPI0035F4B646
MSIDGQIQLLEQKVKAMIENEPGIFLVEIRIKPTNNVKVFLDADTGMSLDKLIHYNRKLYRDLEESGFFPGNDFSLEVSSPGLDEPLKLHRQYLKNVGRSVEVIRLDGVKNEGKLITVSDTDIVVEEEKGKGKKRELVHHTVPFSAIKATRVQIKF